MGREGRRERDCFESLSSHFASYALHNINKSIQGHGLVCKVHMDETNAHRGMQQNQAVCVIKKILKMIFVSVGECEYTHYMQTLITSGLVMSPTSLPLSATNKV